jgi:hypothetical protein
MTYRYSEVPAELADHAAEDDLSSPNSAQSSNLSRLKEV